MVIVEKGGDRFFGMAFAEDVTKEGSKEWKDMLSSKWVHVDGRPMTRRQKVKFTRERNEELELSMAAVSKVAFEHHLVLLNRDSIVQLAARARAKCLVGINPDRAVEKAIQERMIELQKKGHTMSLPDGTTEATARVEGIQFCTERG